MVRTKTVKWLASAVLLMGLVVALVLMGCSCFIGDQAYLEARAAGIPYKLYLPETDQFCFMDDYEISPESNVIVLDDYYTCDKGGHLIYRDEVLVVSGKFIVSEVR